PRSCPPFPTRRSSDLPTRPPGAPQARAASHDRRRRPGVGVPGLLRLMPRARLVGINHVALEVGDLEAALEFYGRIFELELRGREAGMAFISMGDQFIALSQGRTQAP